MSKQPVKKAKTENSKKEPVEAEVAHQEAIKASVQEKVKKLGRLDEEQLEEFFKKYGNVPLIDLDETDIPNPKKKSGDSHGPSAESTKWNAVYNGWKTRAGPSFMKACWEFLNTPFNGPKAVIKKDADIDVILKNLTTIAYHGAAADIYALKIFIWFMDQWAELEAKTWADLTMHVMVPGEADARGLYEMVKTSEIDQKKTNEAVIPQLDEYAAKFGYTYDYLKKMTKVHSLLKTYPVLLYSGASRDMLYHWAAYFEKHMEQLPDDAQFWKRPHDDLQYCKALEKLGALRPYTTAAKLNDMSIQATKEPELLSDDFDSVADDVDADTNDKKKVAAKKN